MRILVQAIVTFLISATISLAEDIRFQLPLDCDFGKTCHIQQFMDHDPSDKATDYGCGGATYDGHKGTDFRINTMQMMREGVAVIAPADGRVVALRDDMTDQLKITDADRASIKGRECGNGIVIKHDGGWRTQYCHMRLGSIAVTNGQQIKRGDTLGFVGASGDTQFPHLHFKVERAGKLVDPFQYNSTYQLCGYPKVGTLWDDAFLAKFDGQITRIIEAGIAPSTVTIQDIQEERYKTYIPSADAGALVAYVMAINVEPEDEIVIKFAGPHGMISNTISKPLDRRKSRLLRFAGKKRPKGGWAQGEYSAKISILRGGKPIAARHVKLVSK